MREQGRRGYPGKDLSHERCVYYERSNPRPYWEQAHYPLESPWHRTHNGFYRPYLPQPTAYKYR